MGLPRWSLSQAQQARTLAGESDTGAAGRNAAPLEGKRPFDRGSLGNTESVLEKTELKHRASPWSQSLLPLCLSICYMERGQ